MLSAWRDLLTGELPYALPGNAEQLLRGAGVPAEASLDWRIGPTLFSSELASGAARLLGERWPALAGHPHARALVLGRSSERNGGLDHAAFVLEPARGGVLRVELAGGATRLVNSDLGAFLRSLEAFVRWWDGLLRDRSFGAPMADHLRRLAAALREIDAPSLDGQGGYWPSWLEDLRRSRRHEARPTWRRQRTWA